MRPTENINELFKKSKLTVSDAADKKIIGDALAEIKQKERRQKIIFGAWRIIMKSRMARYAAVAAIVLVAIASITVFDKTVAPAYAIEQTIEASHSVRYIHIKEVQPGQDEAILVWAEFFDNGQVKSMRMDLPAWAGGSDGRKAVVWRNGQAQVWMKDKGSLIIVPEEAVAEQLLSAIKECDPKLAVERLSIQAAKGEVEIDIAEPGDETGPIVVTVTYPAESAKAGERLVLYVDANTKLVTKVEKKQLNEGAYVKERIAEFYDYNKPIAAGRFELDDEVPADIVRVDQVSNVVGLAQGQMSDDEVAVEVAKQFFEALVKDDYDKAGRLLEGFGAAYLRQAMGDMRVVSVVSVGAVQEHPNPSTKGVVVPCVVEVEKDGKLEQMKFDRLGVRPVYNQPGRWTIFGGI